MRRLRQQRGADHGRTSALVADRNPVAHVQLQVVEGDGSERDLGVTFQVHSDACYGGYAAALTSKADGTRRSAAEIRSGAGSDWPDADWVSSIAALGQADSVSIDPHKMGYVPYSAGAILVGLKCGSFINLPLSEKACFTAAVQMSAWFGS